MVQHKLKFKYYKAKIHGMFQFYITKRKINPLNNHAQNYM